MTGISDSEEEAMGRADLVPFLLEDRIRDVRPSIHQRSCTPANTIFSE